MLPLLVQLSKVLSNQICEVPTKIDITVKKPFVTALCSSDEQHCIWEVWLT